jgi:hypothetical protein
MRFETMSKVALTSVSTFRPWLGLDQNSVRPVWSQAFASARYLANHEHQR